MQQEGEVIETRARLARLNEITNEKSSKPSSGGIKGTLMKFKERRRSKKTSLEGPSTTIHEEGCVSPNSEESRVLKDREGKNKDKIVSSKKSPKTSPKNSPPPITSPVVSQLIMSKLPDEEGKPARVTSTDDALSKARVTSTDDALSKARSKQPQFDLLLGELSQLSLSQSGTYSDPMNTQSSSQSSQESVQALTRSSTTTDFMFRDFLANEQFRNGCPDLYHCFGDVHHQASFEKVLQLLSSAGEEKPVDLNILQDWDGWTLTNKDLV